ncbi:GH85 family endohexosaminidase C-terminal domain-containing protein [Lederbergia ruris]|uniref:GH85 family endohexosaminidase C-terminal domain-containing protein n=1 Tax=Lederbergia ruris TaxID=217495 RepID=UPI0039A00DAA
MALRFASPVESDYEIHIGELALTNDKATTPPIPTGFTIDMAYIEANTAELYLSWDFNEQDVWFYDIHRWKTNGQKEFVGCIYDEVYYIKSLFRLNNESTSTLELVAVGFDGKMSDPAKTILTWPP